VWKNQLSFLYLPYKYGKISSVFFTYQASIEKSAQFSLPTTQVWKNQPSFLYLPHKYGKISPVFFTYQASREKTTGIPNK
ncbi:hypothetical protein, partial [Eremococcus coleocola]|uniref:hypothetical protein n=1 Tax=Eremococcus coleocola TaxID=88132 RepID=UPI001B7FBA87